MDSETAAKAIMAGWEARMLQDQSAPRGKQHYVWASQYSSCARAIYHDVVDGDKRVPWDAETLAKFRRGSDRERNLLADLSLIGRDCKPPFDVIGQQERFELKNREGKVVLAGKVDARVKCDGISMPLECKSWSTNLTDRIKRFEDLFNNRWTERGAYQTLCYLLGSGERYGLMMLDRPGLPRLLPIDLEEHLDRAEAFLTRASQVMEYVEVGDPPPFTTEYDVCKRCHWYGGVCNPPIGSNAAQILTDPDLEAALDQREDLKEAHETWEALDEQVKERLRGIESGIAGKFLIEGSWSKTVSFPVPKEIKEQYRKENPQGKFTLKITRL